MDRDAQRELERGLQLAVARLAEEFEGKFSNETIERCARVKNPMLAIGRPVQ